MLSRHLLCSAGRSDRPVSTIMNNATPSSSKRSISNCIMTIFPFSPASFQRPKRLITSAWIEHAPFAFWLIDRHRPRCVAELGTHEGFSYLCFCQQVQASALNSKCFAIDTWAGDEHAGYYGADVFDHLRRYHDSQYSSFSKLVRSTFDEAVDQFNDESIDLLHIDSRHFSKHKLRNMATKAFIARCRVIS